MNTSDGLDESSQHLVGGLLQLDPKYGHGWVDGANRLIQPLPPLSMRLVRLFGFLQSSRYGGVGVVEDIDHPLHGRWVVFALRSPRVCNFRELATEYNVVFFAGEPGDPRDVGSPWPIAGYTGYECAGFAKVSALEP